MTLSLSLATFCQPNSIFAFSWASRAHSITGEVRWTEGSCSGANIITRVAKMRNVLLQESISEAKVAFVQGLHTPCRAANNRINTVLCAFNAITVKSNSSRSCFTAYLQFVLHWSNRSPTTRATGSWVFSYINIHL